MVLQRQHLQEGQHRWPHHAVQVDPCSLICWASQTLDRQKGTDVVNAACEACKASIEERKGRLVVRASARAVSERDDRLLTDQMKASPMLHGRCYTAEAAPCPCKIWPWLPSCPGAEALHITGSAARGCRACS